MQLTLVTEITDAMINKAFEKINKIHWGGWLGEDVLLGLGKIIDFYAIGIAQHFWKG